MKRFFLDVTIVTMPVLLILGITNYCVDPAHVFNDLYYDEIIEAFNNGYNVTNVKNCNERRLKRKLIESRNGEHYDYLIFGSSRSLLISSSMMDKKILNLSLSSATLEDFLSILKICFENDISYDNVIVSIDPNLFNDKNPYTGWLENADYYYSIAHIEKHNKKNRLFLILSNFFSISYFQSSLKMLFKTFISHGNFKIIRTKSEINSGQTLLMDGSYHFGSILSNKPFMVIKNAIDNGELQQSESDYDCVSERKMKLFELFVEESTKSGKKIMFITFPYPFLQYKRLQHIECIRMQDELIRDYAKRNNIKYYFGMCPTEYNVSDIDFYDVGHMRWETTKKLLIDYKVLD